jgi:hypothetical protein
MTFAATCQHKGRTDIGVAGERQFRTWREYPNIRRVLGLLRRQHKSGFSEIELGRDRLHLLRRKTRSIGNHRKRVTAELPIGEHIHSNEFDLHDAPSTLAAVRREERPGRWHRSVAA